jgi:hypothetical protein
LKSLPPEVDPCDEDLEKFGAVPIPSQTGDLIKEGLGTSPLFHGRNTHTTKLLNYGLVVLVGRGCAGTRKDLWWR